MKLTQANLPRLKIPAGKAELIAWDKGDDSVSGFGVRVRAGGSRTFILQYKYGRGSERLTRRLTLGTTGELTVKEARDLARAAKVAVRQGRDPKGEQDQLRAQGLRAARAKADAFGAMLQGYLAVKQAKTRPKTFEEIERYLRKAWAPLHGLSLSEITRPIVRARLDAITADSGPVASDCARSALSAFFVWAIRQDRCDHNPVADTSRAVEPGERIRERVLSPSEIDRIWRALPDSDYGKIVRLLFLTGQRPNEIAWLRWSELDLEGRWIRLPGERSKNHRPHDISLCALAVTVLASVPRRAGRELLFGEGEGGFSGWTKAKEALDARVLLNEAWQLRDIRRTVVTGLNDAGVAPHVVEAVVNHVTGDAKRGVAGVYNRSKYNSEKRAALDKWGLGFVLGIAFDPA